MATEPEYPCRRPRVVANRSAAHHRRSRVEFGVVIVSAIAFFFFARVLHVHDWLDRWDHVHDRLRVDELFLPLSVSLAFLAVFAWRRYREAHVETELAVAAERDLERTTEEFRSLFDNNTQAVFSIDRHRKYRSLNAAAEALCGYTAAELATLTFPALKTADEDRLIAAFERAMNHQPQRLTASLTRKDGVQREVDITMVPIIVAGDPEGVYTITDDITEDNRIRAQLDQALSAAEQASDAKTLLVANVSHELRTPLTSIMGAAEILADTSPGNEAQHRWIDSIIRNGHSLRRLIEDLLDLTTIESGQMHIETMPFDIRKIVEQSTEQASANARAKGLEFTVQMDESMPTWVSGDPLRLRQVLINLLDNAVKFTEEGEVGLRVEWQRRDRHSIQAVFRVWDTGIGISPNERDRLFEHFVQGDPSRTRRHGGVGLGLSISRQLVELMGGEVQVESQLGTSSTFTARLPLGIRESSPARGRALAPYS